MRILMDECVPKRLKTLFSGHEVKTVTEMGWAGTKNGALLALAEKEFDIFLTVDQNLQYQQNITNQNISVIVLSAKSTDLSDLQALIPKALQLFPSLKKGQIHRVS